MEGYGAGVLLRAVVPDDVPIFFEHQSDPEASAMAAFPSREYDAHMAHWANNVLADETGYARTIDVDGQVAGNVVSWQADGRRLVGYWIGRDFWGRGIATRALAEMLEGGDRAAAARAGGAAQRRVDPRAGEVRVRARRRGRRGDHAGAASDSANRPASSVNHSASSSPQAA